MTKKLFFANYDSFKSEMLDLIEDYETAIQTFKEIFYDLNMTNILQNLGNIYSVLSVIYYGTKIIADELGIESVDTQHTYLSKFLDDLFEFENVFVEQFDQTLFKLMLSGLEKVFDALGDSKSRDDFFKLADLLLKTE